jgi:hypothetical protein
MRKAEMSARVLTYTCDEYSISVREDGHARATIVGDRNKYRRFLKCDGYLFGKDNAADRITSDNSLLLTAYEPFIARDDETCAEALIRYHRDRAKRAKEPVEVEYT